LLIFRDDFKRWYNNGVVLDVGCHVGYLEGFVGKGRYVGIDIVYYGAKPGLFVLCDAHRLPFRDGAFDFVSMVETLEHLYDPTCALREATRVLKVEGRAYVQLVHADDPCAPNDPTHVYAFVEWSLERLLHMFFENVKVERRGGTLLALCERPKLKYFRG